jgi:hypothetical protein
LKRVPRKTWKSGITSITKVVNAIFTAVFVERSCIEPACVQIVEHRVPVVFEGSPATEWAEQVGIAFCNDGNISSIQTLPLIQGLDDILSLHSAMNLTRVQNGWPVFVLRASDGRWKKGPGYDDRVFGPEPVRFGF